MLDQIKSLSNHFFPEIVASRRHLHMHPELSFEEKETSKYIREKLKEKGIPFTEGWGGYGVVVDIVNDINYETIALRGDIDALPILEENEVDYKSKNEGVMHACGHDVHTANLLGATYILHKLGPSVKKNFRIIFQPAEEKLPGGASLLIKEGVLQNPIPKCIIGLHVYPQLEAGLVGFRAGMYMASADEIYLTVKGKGGHGGIPDQAIDTILIASTIVVNLQQLVSRRNNPTIPSVLSVGKITSQGGATNIIPERVNLEGTFRTMNEEWRIEAHKIITSICENTAKAMGGSCEVEIKKGYPFLINDLEVTTKASNAAKDYLGESAVKDLPIRMTSEDFAFYSQEIPSCFFRLGTGNSEKNIISSVHTPTFDIDEEALRLSTGLLAYLAISQ